MEVVRFLERKNVIRFFGSALVMTPFINTILNFLILKSQMNLPWGKINIWASIMSGDRMTYFLGLCSVVIGLKMLGGSAKAWKYVLILVGAHILIQIANVSHTTWQGALAWPSLFSTWVYFSLLRINWFGKWRLKWRLKKSP